MPSDVIVPVIRVGSGRDQPDNDAPTLGLMEAFCYPAGDATTIWRVDKASALPWYRHAIISFGQQYLGLHPGFAPGGSRLWHQRGVFASHKGVSQRLLPELLPEWVENGRGGGGLLARY